MKHANATHILEGNINTLDTAAMVKPEILLVQIENIDGIPGALPLIFGPHSRFISTIETSSSDSIVPPYLVVVEVDDNINHEREHEHEHEHVYEYEEYEHEEYEHNEAPILNSRTTKWSFGRRSLFQRKFNCY